MIVFSIAAVVVVFVHDGGGVNAFVAPSPRNTLHKVASTAKTRGNNYYKRKSLSFFSFSSSSTSISSSSSKNNVVVQKQQKVPIFDFTDLERKDVEKFDRIDDAIMGGISTSQIRQVAQQQSSCDCYASWSGVVRTDGGGFCGTRTLPFQDGKPLSMKIVNNNGSNSKNNDDGDDDDDDNHCYYDGFYLKLRLSSDDEPERRVWKVTTRTENVQNTEQVYQASFEIPPATATTRHNDSNEDDDDPWHTVYVPFRNFVQVRGPRIVFNGPPLDVSIGIYQIGLSLSKFVIQQNVTEVTNFRSGYFDLHIQQIGVYYNDTAITRSNINHDDDGNRNSSKNDGKKKKTEELDTNSVVVRTLTKKEANKKRPLILKALLPIAKLFFNEKMQRRKSVTRILREERNWTKFQIVRFGFRRRMKNDGVVLATARFVMRLLSESVRFGLIWSLNLTVFYPVRFVRRMMDHQQQTTNVIADE